MLDKAERKLKENVTWGGLGVLEGGLQGLPCCWPDESLSGSVLPHPENGENQLAPHPPVAESKEDVCEGALQTQTTSK